MLWKGRDPDPVNIALAAINLASMDLPKVELSVGKGVLTAQAHCEPAARRLVSGHVPAYTSGVKTGVEGVELVAQMTMAIEAPRRPKTVRGQRHPHQRPARLRGSPGRSQSHQEAQAQVVLARPYVSRETNQGET